MAETLKNQSNDIPAICDKQYKILCPDKFSVAVVGDMHLHGTTPRSRVDDFPETTIIKLNTLRRELKEKGIKYLFCAGDVFHVSRERTDYEFKVIEAFRKFKEDGIIVFISNGNHDIERDRLDSIENTSLGILYLTESVSPFTEVVFDRGNEKTPIKFTGVPFPCEIPEVTEEGYYNVCCCHKFYQNGYDKDSLMRDDLERLGYNMYICGHDHVVYETVVEQLSTQTATIVRPGSFTRGTAHNYNTHRMVYYDVITFNGKVQVDRETLSVKNPEDVFAINKIDKVDDNMALISQKLSELVSKMYESDGQSQDIYDVMDEVDIDESVKSRIICYLEARGIFRKNKSEGGL